MLIYLDTNILLSLFDKTARFRNENQLILKQSDLTFISSFITIVEFRSIISILFHENQLKFDHEPVPNWAALNETDKIRLLVETYLDQINFIVYNNCIPEPESFKQIECKVDNNLRLAYQLAPKLHLHTLDLIHIASAMNIKLHQKLNIDYFLTNDLQILDNAKNIRQLTRLVPISSIYLCQILKIEENKDESSLKITSKKKS